MSQLLGRQDCIDSLRKDLVDLQGATLDVLSRTGPVRFSSWKYPDKLSCHLDMVALLEQYDFVEGEDAFNQHSHIVLLELVIDRLLLLLQSFNAYIEQNRCGQRRERTQQRGCHSVGLVVRNYWSNLVQFASFKGPKNQTFDCHEAESVSSVSSSSARSSATSFKFLPSSPSQNNHNVSCQTIQSSLVPCDACHQVQSVLRRTGDALVDLFQSEGLPSSLQPLLAAVDDSLQLGHMTAGDVVQWANEQLRDMRRLEKHLQDVRATVQPLREGLGAAETQRERFRSELERTRAEFKQATEKQQASAVQLEFSLRKEQRSRKETEQRLQEEQQRLKRETRCLEERSRELEEKVAAQQEALQALAREKEALQEALRERVRTLHAQEEEACGKLQQRIRQLEAQAADTHLRLEKENGKYVSACRQQESMQAKQQALLKRVDALDEECEELQRRLGAADERRVDLRGRLQREAEEKERALDQLAQQQDLSSELQKEKRTLETHAGELKEQLQAFRERERLLVAFPELSPLATAKPLSTGDVLLDMEQQLQANGVRIKVLEQENAALSSGLVKLRGRTQHQGSGESSPQPACSSLRSSGAARQGYGDTGVEAGRGESGASGDRVSFIASSPQLHLQTLQLETKSHTRAPHFAPSRRFRQRNK